MKHDLWRENVELKRSFLFYFAVGSTLLIVMESFVVCLLFCVPSRRCIVVLDMRCFVCLSTFSRRGPCIHCGIPVVQCTVMCARESGRLHGRDYEGRGYRYCPYLLRAGGPSRCGRDHGANSCAIGRVSSSRSLACLVIQFGCLYDHLPLVDRNLACLLACVGLSACLPTFSLAGVCIFASLFAHILLAYLMCSCMVCCLLRWPGTNTVEHHNTLVSLHATGSLDVSSADAAFRVGHQKMCLSSAETCCDTVV